MKKSISPTDLLKIQKLVGRISEDDLKYVETYVSKHLGIFIPSVGFCQFAIRAGHSHPSYSFVIFFSENQNFLENTIPLPEGYYLGAALSPDLPHEEEETETFTRYVALFIDRSFYERLSSHYAPDGMTQSAYWQQFPVSPDTMNDIKRFMNECESPQSGENSYLELLAKLITHGLLRDLYQENDSRQPGSRRLTVSAVIDYMEEHFCEKLTVSGLARKMGLSVSQFTRRFKQEIGASPMSFLMALRIKKAQKLLRSGSKTMTEIAQDCGFGSTAHFSSAFKRQTALSPTEYQRLFLKT